MILLALHHGHCFAKFKLFMYGLNKICRFCIYILFGLSKPYFCLRKWFMNLTFALGCSEYLSKPLPAKKMSEYGGVSCNLCGVSLIFFLEESWLWLWCLWWWWLVVELWYSTYWLCVKLQMVGGKLDEVIFTFKHIFIWVCEEPC